MTENTSTVIKRKTPEQVRPNAPSIGLSLRAFSVALLFCSAIACDEDPAIQPNCEEDPACVDQSKLDAGNINGSQDTGSAAPADAGVTGGTDAQAALDAGNTSADSGAASMPDVGFPPPPDAGFPPPEYLTLTGKYDTYYLLDLSSYLWNLGDLAGPVDTIDQVLAGNISTGVSSIDTAIQSAISQFVPPWLTDVVNVLNNASNLFNEVETEGIMVIEQGATSSTVATTTLTSTESWDLLTVRIIEACPMGRSDPNFPACARQPIPISSQNMIGPLEVGIRVKPFTGTTTVAYPTAPFSYPEREVEIELTKLLRIAIDVAIQVETNNQVQGLQDALDRSIDCAGLEAEALRIATGVVGMTLAGPIASAVRTSCEDAKQDAMNAILGTIEAVGVDWEVMVFSQLGQATDTNANGRPETIQLFSTPETISGNFRAVVSDPMGGTWEGVNRNP